MNKKFSTLLAGAALLSAVSANAQIKLTEGLNSGLYQLAAPNGQVLSITENGSGDDVIGLASATASATLGGSMWCVTVDSENQGQNPKFDFTNKTGKFLGLDVNAVIGGAMGADETNKKAAVAGSEVSGWAFSKTFATGVEAAPLYSYFAPDSVVGLVVDGSVVKMFKTSAANATEMAKFTKFTLQKASAITVMNKADFNTVFGTQGDKDGVALTFTPDVKGTGAVNPFNTKKILVENSGDAGWMYVLNTDSSYLYVDTAYTNAVGVNKFLAYNWANLKSTELAKSKAALGAPATAIDSLNRTALKNQYKFQFIYWPSQDSLEIKVQEVRMKTQEPNWVSVTPTVNNAFGGTEELNVSLQELIKDEIRILTVAELQNTKIQLGFAGCAPVKSNKTTVADGVYFIKNSRGQYLAVPIYKGTYDWASATWTTLEEVQNANHMPAYQWVVLKKNTVDASNISPISIANREFANVANGSNVNVANIQLRMNEGGKYLFSENSFLTGDSLEFVKVEEQYYSKAYLGYKQLTDDELLTNKYTFNYWHPYADNKYIAQSESDSVLTVLAGKSAFKLKNVGEYSYGYEVSKAVQSRISKLAQLKRIAYVISKDGANYGYDATEYKYAVSKYFPATDTVYFKENNCIEGVDYYAIIEGASKGLFAEYAGNGNYNTTGRKAGVSDYDAAATLKAQWYDETRTSSFAIAPDNTPLYRHFNNAALGENTDDSTDSLIFVEKIRKEYLMDEWNKNLTAETVDYAGIWAKDKANGKLAFTVDTAWVKRGSGLVKPQYLISVARDDQDAIPGVPCTYEHNHYDNAGNKVDAAHCSHATQGREGFIYGKYLVSFADSVIAKKFKTPYMDIDGGYTRVGFVKAIKVGDSLVVLTNGFEKMEPAKLDTATIFKNYRDNKLTNFIVDLTGDNHKNVTWSFRYVNPDKAGSVEKEGEANEFLFESNIYSEAANAAVTGNAGKAAAGYDKVVSGSIAPEFAAWLKMQNGCLVLTRGDSQFSAAKTGSDGALVFNAYQKDEADDMVTSNDEVAVEGVSVVAGNGTVTVQGAAGKSVVITNILGKVVAETVLTSDNATIAVPAGIVAVAVDGEEAVKTIVK